MSKSDDLNEIYKISEQFEAEAAKNAVAAFNEGFLLGRRYAESIKEH